MTLAELVPVLQTAGCRLIPEGEQLRVQDPKHALTDNLRQAIREHKAALLVLLSRPKPTAPTLPEPLTQDYPCRDFWETAPVRLDDLRPKGVQPTALGEQLAVDAPKGVLPDDLRQAIQEHKQALLSLICSAPERSTSAPRTQTTSPDPLIEERLDLPPCRGCSGALRWLNDGPPYLVELGPWCWHCVTCSPPLAH
jgi:hypothetical protein